MDQEIASILKNGGTGIIPTDTLYGIVGSAYSARAVERIYEVKGRDENKPFIILISSISDLKKFGVSLAAPQKKFLSEIWPDSVSVILPCINKKLEYLHRGKKSLAFRLPKNKKLQELLKKTGPLVAPSANPQGEMPAETIAEAKKYFGKKVDFYVSNSRRLIGKPSTVIALAPKGYVLVRQGKTPIPHALRKLER